MRKTLARLLMGVLAIALAAVSTACSPVGSARPLTGPYSHTVWGPDVSSYQHPYGRAINWYSVRAQGASFAFVKVTEGGNYTNPYASSDLRGARAAGLNVAGYHFARPRLPLSTATTDARRFASLIGPVMRAGYLPPVLDMESTGGLSAANATAWMRTFLSALQTATGRVPMIYSGTWFWQGYLHNPTGFSKYPLWAAQYTSGIGPNLFGDFGYSTFWQYTDAGRVNGISGGVDVSWFHGTVARLNSLSYKSSAATTNASPLTQLQRMTSQGSPAAGVSSGGPTGAHMAQDPGTVGTR
jgi:lysozyme